MEPMVGPTPQATQGALHPGSKRRGRLPAEDPEPSRTGRLGSQGTFIS